MKLQAIKQRCKDRDTILILNAGDGRQWISNGSASWPVEGIRIHEGALAALFDLTPKQVKEMRIEELDWSDERFTVEPQNDYELPLEEIGHVLAMGDIWVALKNDKGVLFIRADELKPIDGKDGRYTFMERWARYEGPMVAVYGDMLTGGLIQPVYGKGAEDMIRGPLRAILETPIREGGRES